MLIATLSFTTDHIGFLSKEAVVVEIQIKASPLRKYSKILHILLQELLMLDLLFYIFFTFGSQGNAGFNSFYFSVFLWNAVSVSNNVQYPKLKRGIKNSENMMQLFL